MLHFRMDMPLYLMAFYGSIMILAVILLRLLLKDKLPKFVFPTLWALVLIRLLIPFSLSSPLSAPVPAWEFASQNTGSIAIEEGTATTAAASSEANAYTTYTSTPVSLPWHTILLIVYLAGIAITVIILCYRKWQYSSKLRNSLLVEHNETINGILRSMNMGHILVYTNDHIASPLVSGIINPRIYLPARMDFQNLQLLRHILAHETTHIRRKDNLIKAVLLLTLCLHWYNPLVWIMSKLLSADIEAACDSAVLKNSSTEDRQAYAYSLLAMAITGNRRPLLYCAFAKTEIERRIQSILSYKRVTALVLTLTTILMLGSTVAFATAAQAPFSVYLSSYCASSNCKWAIDATLTRDIALGENSTERADAVILGVLKQAETNDSEQLKDIIASALAQEFGVEKNAFHLTAYLSLDDKTLEAEYTAHGITRDENGFYLYQGESVRIYKDKMLGYYQSGNEGSVDISILRDPTGNITSVEALHEGDADFDRRTEQILQAGADNTVISGTAASEGY